jgi:flagellin-like protein
MNLKQFFDDSEAVSPVIGVILMVAITVILAAVIGTFVLGLGDQVETTAPSHNFATDANNTAVTFSSTGGQSVDAGNLEFQSDIGGPLQNSTNDEVTDGETWASVAGPGVNSDDSVSAGSSVELHNDSGSWTEGDTVTLVWSDEGQSSTMKTWEAS